MDGRGGMGELTMQSSGDQGPMTTYSNTLPQFELSYIQQVSSYCSVVIMMMTIIIIVVIIMIMIVIVIVILKFMFITIFDVCSSSSNIIVTVVLWFF